MRSSKKAKPAPGQRSFTFVTNAGISLSTEVFAATLEEAAEIAAARGIQSLCHHCASPDHQEEWGTSGELDTGGPGKLTELWVDDAHRSEGSPEFDLVKEFFDE